MLAAVSSSAGNSSFGLVPCPAHQLRKPLNSHDIKPMSFLDTGMMVGAVYVTFL